MLFVSFENTIVYLVENKMNTIYIDARYKNDETGAHDYSTIANFISFMMFYLTS